MFSRRSSGMFQVIDKVLSFEVEAIFFADEGGICDLPVDWKAVAEGWIACLSRQPDPEHSNERRISVLLRGEERGLGPVDRELSRSLRAGRPMNL